VSEENREFETIEEMALSDLRKYKESYDLYLKIVMSK
jgi:hypothetical protein